LQHQPEGSAKAVAVNGISRESLMQVCGAVILCMPYDIMCGMHSQGIHVFRALDQTEFLATMHYLPAFLASRPAVKLVVIDSIAFHFRQVQFKLLVRCRT
jgi:hypothetical protein